MQQDIVRNNKIRMKNSKSLTMMMALAGAFYGDSMQFHMQGEVGTDRLPPYTPPTRTSFKEQPNIVNMITKYKAIRNGTSNLGLRKQERVLSKIYGWVESGELTKEDII